MYVTEKVKCQKIDKYFFRDPEGRIKKYLQFCRRKNCKTESSYNYENLKPKYCFKHKKEDMVNTKRGHKLCQKCKSSYKTKCTSKKCKYTIEKYRSASKYMKLKTIHYLKETKQEFYLCRICQEIVSRSHFDSEEHIRKFNSVISIDVIKSFKNSFISIKCQFFETRYNYIYTDLYFKKHIKDIILKNIDENRFYKSYITKKNMLNFNYNAELQHYTDKFNSNNIINDINNIENLEKTEEYMKSHLIKSNTEDYNYNLDKMYEDLDKVNFIKSGNSITYIHNMGCDIKISECELLSGSQFNFEKIPKIFYDSRVINIIKNKDEKCFIYCYIRKFLNPVKKHGERVSLKDKEICTKLEDELQYNFDNVEINDLSQIENLLETNIYIYTCDKNLKNKIPIYKSDKSYNKILDLLLYENHYMNIKRIDLFFNPTLNKKKYFCRNCCNTFFSEIKYNDHITFCETNKTMILLPSRNKYLQFKNIKNTIQHPFICFADIESYMIYKNEKISNHEHLMSGYYLHCLDEKYSKKVQLFDKLEDFRDNLINEVDYIENINENVFNYEIDMSTFDQKKYDNTKSCKYCNYNFSEKYNQRKIILTEKVDKYKLKRIIDDFGNNNINQETQDNLKEYYNNLNDRGEITITYKQNNNSGRYYSNKFCLQNMFNEVRTSIIHKNCLDVDFKDSIVTIIIYLAEKYNLKIPNIVKYSKDRENILKEIHNDRMTAKKIIIQILNGGFSDEYHNDKNLNKFLKGIEKESLMLHEYFYKIDKRIDDEKIYNYKGKNFSRILQDYENQLLMYLYDYFSYRKIKMMTLIFDGILLFPKQSININEAEKYLFNKSGINMKISIKPFDDHYTRFGETNINIKEFKDNYVNKFYYNGKVMHHNHMLKENNIIDYICQNCNLKIKNTKELIVLFHNSKGYDNAYMIDISSKVENIRMNCLSENNQRFKMLNFKIPGKKYNIKIIDSLSFLQGDLNSLSKDLDNDLKIITKEHFKNNFEMINKKLENFPYSYINPNNLNEKDLPKKEHFYNQLTMNEITNEEYKNVKLFYKKMKFKNLKGYLECYLTSDITLLTDIFNNFRKMIFDEFELDCCKYISSPSLSKDCALKYSKCKIEHIKDVTIFNFVQKNVMGGLSNSINPYIKLDDIKKETIAYNDISSQYPNELRKKLPVSDYKFVKELDETKYGQDKNYGCFLLCDVKTTDKIRNDPLYSQCPMLVSRCKITDKNLSKYQLNQIKEKRENDYFLKHKKHKKINIEDIKYNSQSEKLIMNIGNDSNCYLNFEMYQMFKEAGYEITIKKILEFKHESIFKNYIEFLYAKKKQYSLEKKKSFELIYKILMNSFYGSTLTDKTRFRDIRICTSKRQALKLTKLPTYVSMNPINENLLIVELSKKKCVFDSPIMIGSEVLFNSKCNLYNYMYDIIPKLFGRENIVYSCRDTDSILYIIKNCSYDKYLKTIKENPHLFNKSLGLMENEMNENIHEIISLRSKCYSILTESNNISKSKGINKNYCKKNHNHRYFKQILFNEVKMKKSEYYKISLKDNKLITEHQSKDDIGNFNDKRYMIDNLTSKPHTINV